MSIVELAHEEAQRRGDAQVTAVHLKLGALSGVVKDALLFSFEMACEDTPLKGSRLIIEEVPVLVHCPSCRTTQGVVSVQELCCALCGTPSADVASGRDLELVAMEIQ